MALSIAEDGAVTIRCEFPAVPKTEVVSGVEGPSEVIGGQPVTYAVYASNASTTTSAENVRLRFSVGSSGGPPPTNLASPSNCTGSDLNFDCSLGTLGPSEQVPLRFSFTTQPPIFSTYDINAFAHVTTTTPEHNENNNDSTWRTEVSFP